MRGAHGVEERVIVGRIWWSADSDSPQGGFVLPVELAANLAALGVDVYATVHLEGSSAE